MIKCNIWLNNRSLLTIFINSICLDKSISRSQSFTKKYHLIIVEALWPTFNFSNGGNLSNARKKAFFFLLPVKCSLRCMYKGIRVSYMCRDAQGLGSVDLRHFLPRPADFHSRPVWKSSARTSLPSVDLY